MSKFKEYGQQLVLDARRALERRSNNATFRLSDSIEDVGANNEINIVALRYGKDLQFGRPPGLGEPFLLENISEWIFAKKLRLDPFAVKNRIQKFGTIRYQQIQAGQDPNEGAWISDFATQDAIDTAISLGFDEFAKDYEATIKSVIKI
jgi:hypothetical protein